MNLEIIISILIVVAIIYIFKCESLDSGSSHTPSYTNSYIHSPQEIVDAKLASDYKPLDMRGECPKGYETRNYYRTFQFSRPQHGDQPYQPGGSSMSNDWYAKYGRKKIDYSEPYNACYKSI
jgi:hypothetical protein